MVDICDVLVYNMHVVHVCIIYLLATYLLLLYTLSLAQSIQEQPSFSFFFGQLILGWGGLVILAGVGQKWAAFDTQLELLTGAASPQSDPTLLSAVFLGLRVDIPHGASAGQWQTKRKRLNWNTY